MAELLTKKICLIGEFAVGKTSLVARYLHQDFSDKYLTTVGVSIKTKALLTSQGRELKFVIWDIAGNDALTTASERYLKGADGLVVVMDGTRQRTVEVAANLLSTALEIVGQVPYVAVINKADLQNEWQVADPTAITGFDASRIFVVSAKTGDKVEQVFTHLADAII